ncbi:MAG: glucosamine-6-phosphate deaminase [Janthinobacterium lividum]
MVTINISPDVATLGARAGALGAETIRAAQDRRGEACIVLATGTSQLATLDRLATEPGIDWSRVTAFHLDEYIGLPRTHAAGFRRFLQERFLSRVEGVRFVPIEPEREPVSEIARLQALIGAAPIDLCLAGLGENCHLAFNDPPADFETEAAFLVVELDEACRRQQLGEGWFPALEAVPHRAISMSVRQILRSTRIVLSVPETRKAQAVHDMMAGAVTPLHPASILREHPDTTLFLDAASSALLSGAQ